MRIGAVCSAGGSAFFAAADMFLSAFPDQNHGFAVVTDRACGAESASESRGIPFLRLEPGDKAAFSKAAAAFFREQGCDAVLLFYSRLVGEGLHASLPTLNLHPSLLPAFRGFGALAAAKKTGVRMLGATLHVAVEAADAGPIIAQVASPLVADSTDAELARLSFVQKTYLALLAMDLLASGALAVDCRKGSIAWLKPCRSSRSASPALASPELAAAFATFQQSLALDVLDP